MAGDFAIVVTNDPLTGYSTQVRINVGDSIEGLNAVSIIGGRFKQTDPWILELKRKISSRRIF